MPNFRARRGKIGKTNVNLNFSIFYFFNLTFLNLNLGLLNFERFKKRNQGNGSNDTSKDRDASCPLTVPGTQFPSRLYCSPMVEPGRPATGKNRENTKNRKKYKKN